MKKTFLGILSFTLVCLALLQGCSQERRFESGEQKALQPLPLTQVRYEGELGVRYQAATCNLLTRTDRYSLESFAASAAGRPGALWWDWPGDQIGRWLSVLHGTEALGWTQAAWHRMAVAEVIFPLQTAEGNFGQPGSASLDDVRILSGNAFALRGLMDACADTNDARFIAAARKLARFFEAIAPAWETRREGKLHEFYGHCIDGLVALYEQGDDGWALALAERLAQHAGRTPHTHHSLSLCRGLIDLARVTEKGEYLETVEDYLAWCREHQLVTGGLPEAMPESPQDEGCGLADWIVVNLMMFQATGRQGYVDAAEHTLVNHFFMNQFHTGGFGHLTITPAIVGGKGWQGWEARFGSENPGCCSLWGQWALTQLGRFILTRSEDTVSVNLYPSATIQLPEREMCLEISSDFPRMNKVRIRLLCPKPQTFTLALRVPPWAKDMQVLCNGTAVEKPESGSPMRLTRTWKNQTIIDIVFTTELKTVPWPAEQPQGVGLFDGPLCLGLSGETADLDLPWAVLVDDSGRPVPDSQGRPQVTEPSGRTLNALEPISAHWLIPDVRNPVRKRVLFRIKEDKGIDRKVPVVYCTDLFHPHDDPDDHFDIAALYALEELDIRGIVLDQGKKQDLHPGHIPVGQMNKLTGRNVLWAIGLSEPLKAPDDAALNQEEKYQAGVNLILDVLESSDVPVTVIAVGSLRDVAAAFNRKPDLFRQRVSRLMIFIGEASAGTREWNVGLDPNGFIRIMNSGLPVWWIPCFDGGNFKNRGNASYWRAAHADLFKHSPDRVMNYFIYALLKKDSPNPLTYLDEDLDEAAREQVLSETRNLWCTAVFTEAAGRKIVETEEGWIAVPGNLVKNETPAVEVFRFMPVSVFVDENARVIYEKSERARQVFRFQVVDRESYPRIMTSVTAHLIGGLANGNDQ